MNVNSFETTPSIEEHGGFTETTRSPETSSSDITGLEKQRLSLDFAVSPLLHRPTAPFDRTEQKRAHTSALFYSECFLKGVQPLDADRAAKNAQEQYDKWWVKSTARNSKRSFASTACDTNQDPSQLVADRSQKRRKMNLQESLSMTPNTSGPTKTRIESLLGESDETYESNKLGRLLSGFPIYTSMASRSSWRQKELGLAKMQLINGLKSSGGNIKTAEFARCMALLEAHYNSKFGEGRSSDKEKLASLDGNWLTLSKPTYDECKGQNHKGDLMFGLGRLSFGMFRPTNLQCSLQASFNMVRHINPRKPMRPLHVPRKLVKSIQNGNVRLRTYDIVVAITIEARQDRKGVFHETEGSQYVVPKPIRGILTNQGYAVPDPQVPNRLSIWFCGGTLEVQDEPVDLNEWRRIFDTTLAPQRNLREYANLLAAKLLLGALVPDKMENDGTMSFILKRPIGGHGSAYCDIVYMDEDLRIMRGHHGSVYVCTRVPEPDQVLV